MSISHATRPTFGGKRKHSDFYASVNTIISVLREYSTLQTICNHLNAQGLTTATGLKWTRDRLSSYLKTNDISNTTIN